LKKLLCPMYSIYGWVRRKEYYAVHRTKKFLTCRMGCRKFTLCTLQSIFYTLNNDFK